jgi:hypothetical protein
MATVSLRYPNGRTHEVELDDALAPGAEFDMFGRRWRVLGHEEHHSFPMRYRHENPIVCVPLSPSPLTYA